MGVLEVVLVFVTLVNW